MRKRDKIFFKYCREKSQSIKNSLHIEYKSLRNQVLFRIRYAKKKYYENYFEFNKTHLQKLWEGIKQLGSFKSMKDNHPKTIDLNGQILNDSQSISNAFNNFFINVGPNIANKIPSTPDTFEKYMESRLLQSFYLKPTDSNEVVKIVSSMNSNKPTGPHSIPVRILKDNIDLLAPPLAYLINLSFQTGVFPDKCKIAQVIPIHKKGDHLCCNNYRPISLLSVFSKIIEKCLYKRIYSFLMKNDLIYSKQFGFRTGHSAEHALVSLIEIVVS